jgi:hypothetical protein
MVWAIAAVSSVDCVVSSYPSGACESMRLWGGSRARPAPFTWLRQGGRVIDGSLVNGLRRGKRESTTSFGRASVAIAAIAFSVSRRGSPGYPPRCAANFASEEASPTAWSSADIPLGTSSARISTREPPSTGMISQVMTSSHGRPDRRRRSRRPERLAGSARCR